ncbi:hypothetical protein FHS18_006892 [Paenibacillus phyllosphaerae]|uniref:Uncharacterized protein n=1 Tax=Paenibacillus phyllosphaerae TaxID=274593 RepID=A0A7W5FS69_9BACL|nr:hypothetical protein [Paenibacillus phyllosphaerae]
MKAVSLCGKLPSEFRNVMFDGAVDTSVIFPVSPSWSVIAVMETPFFALVSP